MLRKASERIPGSEQREIPECQCESAGEAARALLRLFRRGGGRQEPLFCGAGWVGGDSLTLSWQLTSTFSLCWAPFKAKGKRAAGGVTTVTFCQASRPTAVASGSDGSGERASERARAAAASTRGCALARGSPGRRGGGRGRERRAGCLLGWGRGVPPASRAPRPSSLTFSPFPKHSERRSAASRPGSGSPGLLSEAPRRWELSSLGKSPRGVLGAFREGFPWPLAVGFSCKTDTRARTQSQDRRLAPASPPPVLSSL